jgi:hypothetical protein
MTDEDPKSLSVVLWKYNLHEEQYVLARETGQVKTFSQQKSGSDKAHEQMRSK